MIGKTLMAMLMGVGLASCSGMSSQQLSFIDQVEQGAIKACGYAPTAESILALVGTLVPGVSAAGPIIDEICMAVNALKPPPGAAAAPRAGQSATVMVRGKAVQGVYTR